MKYLLLIYGNPVNWEHPLFLRNPQFLALPPEERDELARQSQALHREITESGELIVAAAPADPVTPYQHSQATIRRLRDAPG